MQICRHKIASNICYYIIIGRIDITSIQKLKTTQRIATQGYLLIISDSLHLPRECARLCILCVLRWCTHRESATVDPNSCCIRCKAASTCASSGKGQGKGKQEGERRLQLRVPSHCIDSNERLTGLWIVCSYVSIMSIAHLGMYA